MDESEAWTAKTSNMAEFGKGSARLLSAFGVSQLNGLPWCSTCRKSFILTSPIRLK
jgi:hypothetical protein